MFDGGWGFAEDLRRVACGRRSSRCSWCDVLDGGWLEEAVCVVALTCCLVGCGVLLLFFLKVRVTRVMVTVTRRPIICGPFLSVGLVVPRDIVVVSQWGFACGSDVLGDVLMSLLRLEVVLDSSGPGFRQCLPCGCWRCPLWLVVKVSWLPFRQVAMGMVMSRLNMSTSTLHKFHAAPIIMIPNKTIMCQWSLGVVDVTYALRVLVENLSVEGGD